MRDSFCGEWRVTWDHTCIGHRMQDAWTMVEVGDLVAAELKKVAASV